MNKKDKNTQSDLPSGFEGESRIIEEMLIRLRNEHSEGETTLRDNSANLSNMEVNRFKNFDSEEVGSAIKKKRKQQNLSEKELAELAGVSRSTIQKLESGSSAITLSNMRKVMKAVGLVLAWK